MIHDKRVTIESVKIIIEALPVRLTILLITINPTTAETKVEKDCKIAQSNHSVQSIV